MKKKERLTIGCRARVLTIKKKPKRTGPNYYANEDSWRKEYGGREVLLTERISGGAFSVMLLGKEVTELKTEDSKTVADEMAWVPEEDLELINRDFDTNMEFIDWYQEHKYEFCPDCGAWFPNRGGTNPTTKENYECPGCGYSE